MEGAMHVFCKSDRRATKQRCRVNADILKRGTGCQLTADDGESGSVGFSPHDDVQPTRVHFEGSALNLASAILPHIRVTWELTGSDALAIKQ
jgi:hypothetical protein